MNIAPLLLALGSRPTIARLIKEGGDFDLFDAHYYYPDGVAAALLSCWFGKPLVITGRGTDINLLPDYAIPRFWIRWAANKAVESVTVSQALKDRLAQVTGRPDRIRVLPNGVDLSVFRAIDKMEARTRLGLGDGELLLSVGNLVKEKGHDIAIEALGFLPSSTRLAIIGHGYDLKRLHALSASSQVLPRVSFIGTCPQIKLREWYSAADVLVLCSTREGWPNVLLESLACGTPIVARKVGGVPEIIKTPIAGRLIDDGSPAALAHAVAQVLSSSPNPELIRQYAMAFDWRETTQGQIDLFRAILKKDVLPQAAY